MEDATLLRYSRQIMLGPVDIDGQQRLLDACAVIFGLGGLGSPIAMYLAAGGVGKLILVDFDDVELSNLQRQIIHSTPDIGRPKVESARDRITAINPDVEIEVINRKLDGDDIDQVVAQADVVLDGTDNFESRFAINRACYRLRKPLVSGAAIRFEGQVSVYYPGSEDNPCYQCLYRDESSVAERCVETGVIAPLLGIIGSVQALEAMKVLVGIGQTLKGRLLLLDALSMEWHEMRFKRDPKCAVCGSG